ncbi:MAG: FAD-dependent oxidoreductase [Propionibacteriaceae bacterium]|nr:FAD-dependent oxidoreductase [Propionibacteriaceae bacterium]
MTSLWLDTHPVTTTGVPLAGGERYDTVVAGAGLTGLATAVLLARAGQRVAVIEARSVGAVTTGNTTAKLSLLQGRQLSEVRKHHGDEVLAAYVASNLAAQAWLLSFLDQRGTRHQSRTAFTYATTDQGLRSLERELSAADSAGVPVSWSDDAGLPFRVAGAIELPVQTQFHPLEVLDSLLADLLEHGGVLHTGARVQRVGTDDGCRVETSAGTVTAERVILATGVPILDRGAHFARLQPLRSYVVSFRVPGTVPGGMYLSIDQPTRSLRTAPVGSEELLLVGGNGHPVGRRDSTRELVADLESWAGEHFPGATRTHAWSAQDYRPAGSVPLVGELPLSHGRVQVATGYNKWGMTNAVAAALRLAAGVTGEEPPWAEVLARTSLSPADLGEGVRFNAEVAGAMTAGWLATEARGLPDQPPPEGSGVVGRLGGRPAARSTVAGTTCTLSAVCTHLGGIVTWNEAESSWDCPLHGSRFDASGKLLEGPAVSDLPAFE